MCVCVVAGRSSGLNSHLGEETEAQRGEGPRACNVMTALGSQLSLNPIVEFPNKKNLGLAKRCWGLGNSQGTTLEQRYLC